MKVLKAGTIIKTKIGDIEGIITGVLIRENSIEYNVSYFAGGLHYTVWVFSYEVEKAKVNKGAGFNRDTTEDETSEATLLIE